MADSVVSNDIKEIILELKREAKLLEGKTLLISGGAGFLGSYILATIHELNNAVFTKPCKVISIDNFITGKKRRIVEELKNKNFKFINADVTKPFSVSGKVDFIIHAAGLASPVYYQKYPLETINSAINGAINLLDIAKKKKVKSFLYFSSSEIYGDPDKKFIPTPEIYRGNVSSIGPRACYDESKRLGETICMVYYNLYRVPIKIVRPFNIYGPGMYPDDLRVVPAFITSALKNEAIQVHDSGKQTRTFCYINDAICGFFKVLLSKKDGEVYNVGNDDKEITMLNLARYVKKVVGGNIIIKNVRYPKLYPQGEPKRRCPDLTKIKKLLNYHSKISLSEGLVRTIAWYREERLI